jgi:predicted PurR-regulated permease PerM
MDTFKLIFIMLLIVCFVIMFTIPVWAKALVNLMDSSPKWERRLETLSDWLQEVHPNRTQVEATVTVLIIIFFFGWLFAK